MSRHIIHLSDVQRKEVVWLAGTPIPRGMFSILAGHPGLGKSMWTALVAARATQGGGNVIICSAEDSLEHTLKPRMQAAGAHVSHVHALVPVDEAGDPRGISFPSDSSVLLEAILSANAILAVVDPVTAVLDSGVDSHKDASLRSALASLSRIADETTAAILGVMHLNKAGGVDPIMRVGGSIGGPGQARSMLLLDRDPDDPGGERGTRRVLAHFKSNIGPLLPSRLLEVEPIHLPASELEPAMDTARIVDLGECGHAAGVLLAANGSDRTAVEEAAHFLRAELAGGVTIASKQIIGDAKENGIAEKTLRRAAKNIGVVIERAGFGKDGVWSWRLPIDGQTCPTPSYATNLAINDDDVAIYGSNGAGSRIDGQIGDTGQVRAVYEPGGEA